MQTQQAEENADGVTDRMAFWQMVKEITNALIQTDQLIITLILLVLLAIAIWLPAEDLGWVIRYVLIMLTENGLVGYALCVVLAMGWRAHVRALRQMHRHQIRRAIRSRKGSS